MSDDEWVAAWADFALVSQAVIGDTTAEPPTFDELARATTVGDTPVVLATQGVAARNAAAYQLQALGYSAHETADVVSGRIGQHALDTARQMIAIGRGREAAANYLDREYALRIESMTPPGAAPETAGHPLDTLIEQYADLHHVEAAIVKAIVATESAFHQGSRSSAGAIGLMQLMPATARALGVNPLVPAQNLEGGVRYFSHLLRTFGGLELALVAYNAGPGFAHRYARGDTALYGETREYVRRVLSHMKNPRWAADIRTPAMLAPESKGNG